MSMLWRLLLLLWCPLVLADDGVFVLGAESWASPRHGESVLQMTPVAQAVTVWLAKPQGSITISYPQGDEGGLWAEELRSWLISLGIASDHIILEPAELQADRIEIRVQDKLENTE